MGTWLSSLRSALAHPPGSVEDGLSNSVLGLDPDGHPNEELLMFRLLVGITSSRSLDPPSTGRGRPKSLPPGARAASNLGIYRRVVQREAAAKRTFKLASMLINGCLGVQIIVAASLTAMGAANSNHNAVTAFGAINTIIAGLLTYIKGSGLPNRFKYYQNEWRKVREHIEQKEREFSGPGPHYRVHDVIQDIRHMYETVRADIELNTPDSYVSISDIRNRPNLTNPAPALDRMSSSTGGWAEKGKDWGTKLGEGARRFSEMRHSARDKEAELEKDAEREVESRYSHAQQHAKDKATGFAEGVRREAEDFAMRSFTQMSGETENTTGVTISLARPHSAASPSPDSKRLH